MTLTITVVMATHRRPESLARALAGLADQQVADATWDVVVVDNEPAPGSEDVVAAARSFFPVPLSYVREPRPGSAHARNRGLAEVTGQVTVITDDDVVADAGWLQRLVEPIATGVCDGTAGSVVLDPAIPRPGWFTDEGIGQYLAHYDAPGDWLGADHYVLTANCALSTDLLARTGGFDPRLGPRPGVQLVNDDVSLTRRYLAAGGKIRGVPEAVVVHELSPERLRPGYLLRRAWAQGRSDWILDAEPFRARRARGLGVVYHWMRASLRGRVADGWSLPTVFRAACDMARAGGLLREWLADLGTSILRRGRP